MRPRQVTVFLYGLFMDVELLLSKGVHPMNPRPARGSGFALRIGRRATLIPNAQSFAYGIILELSHGDIEQLYSDASVSEYRPEAVLANSRMVRTVLPCASISLYRRLKMRRIQNIL